MLHQRIGALFGQSPHDTCERLKGMGTYAVLGAVRYLAGDDCPAQGPFGPTIRRLDPRVAQEAEHGAPVMMPARFIEQPLMVGIFQMTVPQLIRELCLQRFGLDLGVSSGGLPLRVPQRQRLLPHRLQRFTEVPGPACPSTPPRR